MVNTPSAIKKTYKEFGRIKRPRNFSNEQKQEILQKLFQKDSYPPVFQTLSSSFSAAEFHPDSTPAQLSLSYH